MERVVVEKSLDGIADALGKQLESDFARLKIEGCRISVDAEVVTVHGLDHELRIACLGDDVFTLRSLPGRQQQVRTEPGVPLPREPINKADTIKHAIAWARDYRRLA